MMIWALNVLFSAVNVYVLKDRVTNAHQGPGFVEFISEDGDDYEIKVLNMIKLYGVAVQVNRVINDRFDIVEGLNTAALSLEDEMIVSVTGATGFSRRYLLQHGRKWKV